MPSETDPLLAEKKEPELTQGGGVHSRQPPATPGAGTAPPSSTNSSPASVTTADIQDAVEGQNQNVENEDSTDESRGEGSPGTGGGSGQGTTNEATEGDSIAYKVQTFFAVAVAALLTFLKNYHKTFIALLKAYWKSKWFNITLVLISSVYTLIAPKMIELKHPWFCAGGGMLAPHGILNWMLSHSLFAAAAIKSACTLEDTNETVHKMKDEFNKKITEERLTAIDKIDGMEKMLERILEKMGENHGEESSVGETIENVGAGT